MNDYSMEEIRQIKHRISEEHFHNPKQYIEYLQKQSVKYSKQIERCRNIFKNREMHAIHAQNDV